MEHQLIECLANKVPEMFIGVDPGVTGWIAALSKGGEVLSFSAVPMRFTKDGKRRELDVKGCVEVIRKMMASAYRASMAVEKIDAGPFMSKRASVMLSANAATFVAVGYALGIQTVFEVRPAVWQHATLPSGPAGTQKDRARAFALDRWSDDERIKSLLRLKKNQGLADALLIAEWRRQSCLAALGLKI